MADTWIVHAGEVDASAHAHYDGLLRPELFVGNYEAQLGKSVKLTQFGVNYVRLEPGAASALRHWHEGEDEFVYVLDGKPTLIDDNGAHGLAPGSFVGFPAGTANGHHIVNHSDKDATFLAIGSRRPGEDVTHYPDDPIGPIRR